ncbi:hypothetical protein CRG98_006738 [Punica granatum]|uniref:Uncharacterized protein n=1 Tax=Punica granatum TaxID=22663 RepID=A0A2I0KX17_PUNGR|nr:hypothetical protein CRG98_006738 [Punica granatum]
MVSREAAPNVDPSLSPEEWSVVDAWKLMISLNEEDPIKPIFIKENLSETLAGANAPTLSNIPVATPSVDSSAFIIRSSHPRKEYESSDTRHKKKKARTEVKFPIRVDVSEDSDTLSRGPRTGLPCGVRWLLLRSDNMRRAIKPVGNKKKVVFAEAKWEKKEAMAEASAQVVAKYKTGVGPCSRWLEA